MDSTHNVCPVEYSSHSLSCSARQLMPNMQLLCVEDGNGHSIKICWWGNSDNGTPQHAFSHLLRHSMHIQGRQGWYLAAYTMSIVWKCRYIYFGGLFLWIQHHETLFVLCLSSNFIKSSWPWPWNIEVGQRSQSVLSISIDCHIYRTKMTVQNAVCH